MVIKKKLFLLIIILVSASLVNAFGVSLPYTTKIPLEISPGETKTFEMNFQNGYGGEDVIFEIEMIDDGGIAKINDKEKVYEMPFGTPDINIPVEIDIPKNTVIGEEITVMIRINPLMSVEGEGMIKIKGGTTVSFLVKVVQKENKEGQLVQETKKENIWEYITLIILLLILAAVAVIVFFYRRKKVRIKHKIHR